MADLVVLGFASKERAEAVLVVTRGLQREQLVDLQDAALVWRNADGRLRMQQSFGAPTTGALWGALLGQLFLMPVFGLAVGAADDAVEERLSDVGIDEPFVREVAETLEPGAAAVFALVRRTTPARLRQELATYRPSVVRACLAAGTEAELVRRVQVQGVGSAALRAVTQRG